MKLISAAKYAALGARLQRTEQARETAEKLAADRLATITRLRSELEQARDAHPDTPLPQPPAAPGDVELRRQLALAQRTILQQSVIIDGLQASHIADTRELHDLRQGVTS